MTNFIPSSDSEFGNWAESFLTSVAADPTAYGLTAEIVTELQADMDSWDAKFADLFQKRDAAKSATVRKDQVRKLFEGKLRTYSRQIQGDPNVTDAQRADAGLPVHSTARNPIPAPTTTPIAKIDASNVLRHEIKFTEATNAHSNTRPTGVAGIQVYGIISETEPEFNAYQLIQTSSRMTTTINFPGSDGGRTIWYRFRYLGTKLENGPWRMVNVSTILK